MKKVIGVIAALFVLTGCSKITLDNYNEIKSNMSYDDVVSLLGKPNSCDGMSSAKSCLWGDEKKGIRVAFLSDEVLMANYHGLE